MKEKTTPPDEIQPEQEGDVLGISQSKGRLPIDVKNRHRSPKGIELDTDVTDSSLDGSPGYTGSDMGAGGTGNTIKRRR